MEAHRFHNPKVAGSTPAPATMKNREYIVVYLIIFAFIMLLCVIALDSCTMPAQQVSVCNDTMYVRLCGMPVSQMTDDEYQSYLRMDEDCQAQLRAKKILKIEDGNGGK